MLTDKHWISRSALQYGIGGIVVAFAFKLQFLLIVHLNAGLMVLLRGEAQLPKLSTADFDASHGKSQYGVFVMAG